MTAVLSPPITPMCTGQSATFLSASPADIAKAKEICSQCALVDVCRAYAQKIKADDVTMGGFFWRNGRIQL